MNAQPCPCCQRSFKSIFDYPRVLITRVAVLPPPEQVIDKFSREARDMQLRASQELRDRQRQGHPVARGAFNEPFDLGIDVTRDVALAHQALQEYFDRLKSLQGQELAPNDLFPDFELSSPPRYYKIPGSRLHVTLSETTDRGYLGVCEVKILVTGAIGPGQMALIHPLCTAANIHYEGQLVGPCGESA